MHPITEQPAIERRGNRSADLLQFAQTRRKFVRFAHDPRTQQMAMLEGDRFMVLDLTTRAESDLVGVPIRDMPAHGALIGAILRNGEAIFPHGSDTLRPGDRVIVFTETARALDVERAL